MRQSQQFCHPRGWCLYIARSSHSQWQRCRTSISWTWLNRELWCWEGGQFHSLGTCTMPCLHEDEAVFDLLFSKAVACSARDGHVHQQTQKTWFCKSWGDQDEWMRDNKETTNTEITTMCQFWKGSSQGYLRSISLTPVPIKTLERFSYSSTDRNTQLMLVKLAARAGCLVLFSNRSVQLNLTSLLLRVMNQRKSTSV